jgi:hypothetical protein
MPVNSNRHSTAITVEAPHHRTQRKAKSAFDVGLGPTPTPLPALRFDVLEAAQILRMSRAQLYNRMRDGMIKGHKDGARTYITRTELERYVRECDIEVAG